MTRLEELVEGYRASGLTLEQFAEREGINWHIFSNISGANDTGGMGERRR